MHNFQGLAVAIYARYSSERQRDTSIEDQVRRCREYIIDHDGNPDAIKVFADHAVSGASLDRLQFEALMEHAVSGRIAIIVTEDMSRMSRDWADCGSLFKKLQFANVPLIGIADGIDTGVKSGKMNFQLKALVSEMYLDDLRDKTLRGLEGRFHAGFSTGNLPYGLKSIKIDGSGGEVIGHQVAIDEERAKVIVRIFEESRNNYSLTTIAAGLNSDGIPSPREGSRHKNMGWGASTIRSMLLNEKYAGVFRYKQRQWVKVPGTNKRQPRCRDKSEVLSAEYPELRIINEELWIAVQTRLAAVRARYTKKGAGKGTSPRRTPYLLSGLLECGACHANMVIYGGASTRYYRCNTAIKRGTCSNRHSVRENVTRTKILEVLREKLMSDRGIAYVHKRIAERLGDLSQVDESELRERRSNLTQIERKIENLVEFIANGQASACVARSLCEYEERAETERKAITKLANLPTQIINLPTVAQLTGRVFDIEARLTQDAHTGREQLRRLLRNGKITLLPDADGIYTANSEILPMVLLAETANRRPGKPMSAVYKVGSGD